MEASEIGDREGYRKELGECMSVCVMSTRIMNHETFVLPCLMRCGVCRSGVVIGAVYTPHSSGPTSPNKAWSLAAFPRPSLP